MPGPEFLVVYFFVIFGTTVTCTIISGLNNIALNAGKTWLLKFKQICVILGLLVVDGLGGYKLIMALSHGHNNVGVMLVMAAVANVILLIMLLSRPSGPRVGGPVYVAGPPVFGVWSTSSCNGCGSSSSCSSSSSSSSSSCSSGSSCGGGGGCGGCGSS